MHAFKAANGKSLSEAIYHRIGQETDDGRTNGNPLINSLSCL